uniref:Thymopoietin b n=1 Tax=Gasterosteus aculeatus aculeatus TaxID=481459 RepID=A0AAQ4R121_GASAC
MADFHENPSVLTKEKLKSELAANNVYVQLYLKNLTALKEKKSAPTDTFSSDEDLPLPVMSGSSRSGRKATKKTDRPRSKEVEVTDLTDDDLKQQLEKHGVQPGPIVASTRKLYEKKLQKLLDQRPAEPHPQPPPDLRALPNTDGNPNGNTNSEQYSDKEDEGIAEPKPVPVVENPETSRGKTRGTTSSRPQTKARHIKHFTISVVRMYFQFVIKTKNCIDHTNRIVKTLPRTPTRVVTCRRPIRGAACRPLKQSEYWLDESRLQHSVHTEIRSYFESLSRVGSSVSPGKAPAQQGFLSMLLKLLLLVAVAGSLLYAYQNLDADSFDTLKGALDHFVVVPLHGAVNSVATYLGIGGARAAEIASK